MALGLISFFILFSNISYAIYSSGVSTTTIWYQLARVSPELVLPLIAFAIFCRIDSPADLKQRSLINYKIQVEILRERTGSLKKLLDELKMQKCSLQNQLRNKAELLNSLKKEHLDALEKLEHKDSRINEVESRISQTSIELMTATESLNKMEQKESDFREMSFSTTADNSIETAFKLLSLFMKHRVSSSFLRDFKDIMRKDHVLARSIVAALCRFEFDPKTRIVKGMKPVRGRNKTYEIRINNASRIFMTVDEDSVVFTRIVKQHIKDKIA